MLFVKTIIGICFQMLFFAALMMMPIGTTDWPAAVIWLQLYAVMVGVATIYLLAVRPAAVEARMRAGGQKQPTADKWALGLVSLALSVPIGLASKDVFDWQILGVASTQARQIGLAVFVIGFVVVIFSMLQNEYAAPTVHIQEDAGHVLVDTGLYGLVRHPMYLGFLLFTIGTTLWLGSIAASITALTMVGASLAYRIEIEEATLSTQLPGYEAYKGKVKTRFLPFIY